MGTLGSVTRLENILPIPSHPPCQVGGGPEHLPLQSDMKWSSEAHGKPLASGYSVLEDEWDPRGCLEWGLGSCYHNQISWEKRVTPSRAMARPPPLPHSLPRHNSLLSERLFLGNKPHSRQGWLLHPQVSTSPIPRALRLHLNGGRARSLHG